MDSKKNPALCDDVTEKRDQAIRGRNDFDWSEIDFFHLWININLRAELEGNPSYWVAFSTSDSALFFSLFYVFYFLLSLTSSCIEKPVRHKDKIKAKELPWEEVERFTKRRLRQLFL